MKKTFTLLELLIVVTIIAILAGIALENIARAQVRAKVARVQSEFKTLETAMAAYQADNNAFPRMADYVFYADPKFDYVNGVPVRGIMSRALSTPIAYVSDFRFFDPYQANNEAGKP